MLLGTLRRARLLSALLLAASPAGAGTWLPLVHPCPVDTPWLLHDSGGGHATHHGRQHSGSDATGEEHTCHCIGSGLAAAALLPPAVEFRSALETPAEAPGWTVQDASLVLASRSTLLPPATAPPLD